MARSGAFKKKAAKARKKNPLTYGLDGVVNITDTYERSVASSRNLAEHYANQLRMRGRDDIVYVVFGITPEAKAQAGRYRNGVTITLEPRDYEIAYAFHPTQGEISRQLKAQRDAERRAFTRQGMKLKSNPRASNPIILVSDKAIATKRKANPVKPKRQRMLNISWMTAGGQREIMSVPIDFVFTHYVGNVAERFFVRTDNGQLIVSEYSTGGRIGQVPYTMRAAALNDRDAAKRYVGEMLSRIGAERFKAAVKKFDPIN